MSIKLSEEVKPLDILPPQNITSDTTTNGTGQSVAEFEDDALAVLTLGAIAPNGASVTVNIQGSDAVGGTYTTITSFTAAAGTDDDKTAAIPVNIAGSTKAFVRAQVVTAGSTTGAQVAVSLLVNPMVAKGDLNAAAVA